MESFQKIECLRVWAWKLFSGIDLFVDDSHFLDFRSPECAVMTRMLECSFSALAVEPSLHTQVNFVLNPKHYYADPLASIFEGPSVKRVLIA